MIEVQTWLSHTAACLLCDVQTRWQLQDNLHQCSRPQTVSQRSNRVSASIINHRITLTGGRITVECAIVCRWWYQSAMRRHKYCTRPLLLRLSEDEGGIGHGAGKVSTWFTKARTCLTGNCVKKFRYGYLGYPAKPGFLQYRGKF